LWGLADVAEQEGDLDGARLRLHQALEIFEAIAETEMIGHVYGSLATIARASGRDDDAIRHLDRAIENDAAVGVLAMRACYEGGDAAAAERELESRMSMPVEMHARYLLYRATGNAEHLAAARASLEKLRENAPEGDREAMLECNRLHRAIVGET